MSQLLDDIMKIQAATGCTVLEGKKFLELADGDVDLAIVIAQEEMAKPKPAPQPAPQPQQYQQPQQQYPQQNYQQGYYQQPQPQYQQPQLTPQQQKQRAAAKMKMIRMPLYGLAAIFALCAILMFFSEFLQANLLGYHLKETGFELLKDKEALEENPGIYTLIVSIVFFGATSLFSLISLGSSSKRNMGVIPLGILAFAGAIIVFMTVQLCGDEAQGAELGSGAIGSGIFGILAAIFIIAAGVMPNFFYHEQPRY